MTIFAVVDKADVNHRDEPIVEISLAKILKFMSKCSGKSCNAWNRPQTHL